LSVVVKKKHFAGTLFSKDGTKIVTRIKKVTGDIDLFVRELRIVLSLPKPANQLQSYDAIRMRTGNMIEIHGHRAADVRNWLGGLGF
jgi:Mitochondrial large subunit ribosomal protein (Img2)